MIPWTYRSSNRREILDKLSAGKVLLQNKCYGLISAGDGTQRDSGKIEKILRARAIYSDASN